MRVHEFVDERRGHPSDVIDVGDGTAAPIGRPRFPTERVSPAPGITVMAIATPGHTPDRHTSALDANGAPAASFHGGSSMVGPPRRPHSDGPVTVTCGHRERAVSAAGLIAAGDVTTRVFDGGPDTWATATGTAWEAGR